MCELCHMYPSIMEAPIYLILNKSNNNLRWIPLTLFSRMKALQSLNLAHNHLLNIDQGYLYKQRCLFATPNGGRFLFLNFLQLFSIYIIFFCQQFSPYFCHILVKFPSYLVNLDVSSNQLSKISRRFLHSAHNLKTLNLNNNTIATISQSLKKQLFSLLQAVRSKSALKLKTMHFDFKIERASERLPTGDFSKYHMNSR